MASHEEDLVLSNLPPSRTQQKLALSVALVIVLAASLISATGLQQVKLPAIDALVPLYGMAMFVSDSITAVLLFTQFSIVRSRALLVISSGYVWTALVVIPWLLSFPGVFAPRGLLGGSSSEITVWLYSLWHAGFPMFVIAYALLKDARPAMRPRGVSAGSAILHCYYGSRHICGDISIDSSPGAPAKLHDRCGEFFWIVVLYRSDHSAVERSGHYFA
jgi:hypothetical protein